MRYVLLGTLSAEWVARQTERLESVRAKLAGLGITVESISYTQGPYDFVTVVDSPDPRAVLTFSIWYAKQGYGRVTTMPAFDEAAMEAAVANV
jgi:uncharacterized protein with GYD domain